MKKIFIILILSLFISSCWNQNEIVIKNDTINNDTVNNENNITNTLKNNIDILLTEVSEKIESVIFDKEEINKIDWFYIKMINSKSLNSIELDWDTVEQVKSREFKNLKLEVKWQLPVILNTVNNILKISWTWSEEKGYLKTSNWIKFERLINILNLFDFENDFEWIDYYKIDVEEDRFNNLKKTYNNLKVKK